mmetsp:Transcript_35272/g.75141  ORF Transcript_35272/g.75141 Transcript_35272/m.75141 type:complete len:647 (+) Transcript_35272:34-1974(+)
MSDDLDVELAPFDADGTLLKDLLLEADVALVKVGFLRQLQEKGGKLVRRQALPPDALVCGEDLRPITFGKAGTRLFVISHAWLSREHPDPMGIRLKELVVQLTYVSAENSSLVFFDFCSLYQVDKTHSDYRRLQPYDRLRAGHPAAMTPPQVKAVKAVIARMDTLYASAASEVIVLPVVYKMSEIEAILWTPIRHDYINRGWCFVEFCVAQMFNRVANAHLPKTRALLGVNQMIKPEKLDKLLQKKEKEFSIQEDQAAVLPLYRRLYAAASKAEMLKDVADGSPEEHTEALLCGLSALRWNVRRDFVQCLGKHKVHDLASAVCGALADDDFRVRLAAQDASKRLRPVKNLNESLEDKWKDDDSEARVEMMKGLSKEGTLSFTQAPNVAKQLASTEIFVVNAAKETLLPMGLAAADAVAPLLAGRGTLAREAAIQILDELGPHAKVAAAESVAQRIRSNVDCGPGDSVRQLLQALGGLSEIVPTEKHAAVAAPHLGSRDASVRCAAADTILTMGASGIRAASALLNHHDAEIRVQGLRALRRFAKAAADERSAVATRLDDESWTVRRAAIATLASFGPEAVEADAGALRRLKDEDVDDDVRLAATEALADAGVPLVGGYDKPDTATTIASMNELLNSLPEDFPDLDM